MESRLKFVVNSPSLIRVSYAMYHFLFFFFFTEAFLKFLSTHVKSISLYECTYDRDVNKTIGVQNNEWAQLILDMFSNKLDKLLIANIYKRGYLKLHDLDLLRAVSFFFRRFSLSAFIHISMAQRISASSVTQQEDIFSYNVWRKSFSSSWIGLHSEWKFREK